MEIQVEKNNKESILASTSTRADIIKRRLLIFLVNSPMFLFVGWLIYQPIADLKLFVGYLLLIPVIACVFLLLVDKLRLFFQKHEAWVRRYKYIDVLVGDYCLTVLISLEIIAYLIVVPKFEAMYKEMNLGLQPFTIVLLWFSHWAWIAFVIPIIMCFFVGLLRKGNKIKELDTLKFSTFIVFVFIIPFILIMGLVMPMHTPIGLDM